VAESMAAASDTCGRNGDGGGYPERDGSIPSSGTQQAAMRSGSAGRGSRGRHGAARLGGGRACGLQACTAERGRTAREGRERKEMEGEARGVV
jgi:hypothetical protein